MGIRIVEDSGSLICDCGNQELVLVRCLPPFADHFRILCRKCLTKDNRSEAVITAKPESLRPITAYKVSV